MINFNIMDRVWIVTHERFRQDNVSINMCNSIICNKENRADNTQIIITKI